MDNESDSDKRKKKETDKLFDEFHSRMLVLIKKQSKLIERAVNLVNKKKAEEIRNKIKKF
ncbi:hypothetical protein KAS31_02220 [Candidatus Parcubacteria bacterium]|nr:hypothetical protein [Candidatus Parcubacteria bacterium]